METIKSALIGNKILSRALRIQELENELLVFFPEKFKKHLKLVNYHNGVLIWSADNAPLCNLLRFQIESITIRIKSSDESRFSSLQSMKILHNPRGDYLPLASNPSIYVDVNNRKISAKSAAHLLETANKINHASLADVLRRLASKV